MSQLVYPASHWATMSSVVLDQGMLRCQRYYMLGWENLSFFLGKLTEIEKSKHTNFLEQTLHRKLQIRRIRKTVSRAVILV